MKIFVNTRAQTALGHKIKTFIFAFLDPTLKEIETRANI